MCQGFLNMARNINNRNCYVEYSTVGGSCIRIIQSSASKVFDMIVFNLI